MSPEERAVLVDAVAKTLAAMRFGAGESYTIWNAEADEIVEKLFSPRVVPCSECGGTEWTGWADDGSELPCTAGCDHGQVSLPPLAVSAEHAETLRESLARMVRWTEGDAEYMSTAELAEYRDDIRTARALLGETSS